MYFLSLGVKGLKGAFTFQPPLGSGVPILPPPPPPPPPSPTPTHPLPGIHRIQVLSEAAFEVLTFNARRLKKFPIMIVFTLEHKQDVNCADLHTRDCHGHMSLLTSSSYLQFQIGSSPLPFVSSAIIIAVIRFEFGQALARSARVTNHFPLHFTLWLRQLHSGSSWVDIRILGILSA